MRKRTTTGALMATALAVLVSNTWAAPAPRAQKPVASTVAPNGNVVKFYDGGDGVLVTETGVAYSNPFFDPQGKSPDRLLEAWRSVAPNAPFPAALAQLEKRMKARKNSAHKETLPPPVALFKSRPESKPAGGTLMPQSSTGMGTMALEGCDNGCCDREWLSTFDECIDGPADFNWFLFNYGYTWSNSEDIWIYRGLVCSANGTSTFNMRIGDRRWSEDVPHGHLQRVNWLADQSWWRCGGWCGKNMTSTVNTPSAQSLHTYCGWTYHD